LLLGEAEEQKKTLKQEKSLKLGDCACMRNGGNENTCERPGNKAKKKMKLYVRLSLLAQEKRMKIPLHIPTKKA